MQKIVRSIALAYNNLSRSHRFILGSLTVVTLAAVIWQPPANRHQTDAHLEYLSKMVPLLEPSRLWEKMLEASEPMDQPTPEDDIPKDELDDKTEPGKVTHEYVISSGDTLSSIFTQYGIDSAEIAWLTKQNPTLRNLKVGQTLSWRLNEQGDLQQLAWTVSRRETRTYDLIDGNFKESVLLAKGEWKNQVITGKLNSSFINSAQSVGLQRAEINAVIKALQWQMDFRKLQKGDQFAVLMSREMLNGRSEQSQLLGVRIHSSGKDYYAVQAPDGKYYDRQGGGLSKGFMRFPTIKQFRVSSNFNPRRLNPVTGRIAPHTGVDFSMPVGTPILAVADGEVVIAKRSGDAGNYVAIRHGRQYTTRYMHLKKLLVTPGQKVKRGDRIALSGNTGRSTGPHLHYELWTNNQAVNPMTAKLPPSEGLNGKERSTYLAQVREVIPQLQFN